MPQAEITENEILRRQLAGLIEGYVIETSTVLATPEPVMVDSRSYRAGFNAGARSALARVVADIRDVVAS